MKLVIVLVFIFSLKAAASSERFNLNYMTQNSTYQNILQTASTATPAGFSQTQTLGYQNDELVPHLSVSSTLAITQPSYAGRIITEQNGQQRQIVGPYSEIRGDIQTDYAAGPQTVTLGVFSHLSESIYPQKGMRVAYKYSFYGKSTILGARAVLAELRQPQSYFIGLDFKTHARPTLINGQETALNVEQVLHRNWKAFFEVSTGQRQNERPRFWGASLKQRYAFSGRVFGFLDLDGRQETPNGELQDERGFYSSGLAEAGASWEVTYDIMVSASYGIQVERENDPRRANEIQVGSDIYGLGTKYSVNSGMDLQAQGSYFRTNAGQSGFTVNGGVVWNL